MIKKLIIELIVNVVSILVVSFICSFTYNNVIEPSTNIKLGYSFWIGTVIILSAIGGHIYKIIKNDRKGS